jgi:hypothetical protein
MKLASFLLDIVSHVGNLTIMKTSLPSLVAGIWSEDAASSRKFDFGGVRK